MKYLLAVLVGYTIGAIEFGNLATVKWAGWITIMYGGIRATLFTYSFYKAANELDQGKLSSAINKFPYLKKIASSRNVRHYIENHQDVYLHCNLCNNGQVVQ